jgi:mevalonate kinase
MSYKASAPGSLMLLGEYSVLDGGYALVSAINHRMFVTLTPRTDNSIIITSQLGTLKFDLSQIEIHAPFQFVLTVLKKYQHLLPSGCDLHIASEFSDQIGFASSAAVTVALLCVLHTWLNKTVTAEELIIEARAIVRAVQGVGSGADVAACVLGGVVAYRAKEFYAEKLTYHYPISAVYSGSKTKTVDAIQLVKNYFSNYPELFNKITQGISECTVAGIQAVRDNNHHELGKIMDIQQGFMESLGVCTPTLREIISHLKGQKHILGAKISGSGFGDCAIGLGAEDGDDKIKMTSQGVYCEQN